MIFTKGKSEFTPPWLTCYGADLFSRHAFPVVGLVCLEHAADYIFLRLVIIQSLEPCIFDAIVRRTRVNVSLVQDVHQSIHSG